MAAPHTVPEVPAPLNSRASAISLQPSQGVITLVGFGISALVDHGHLVLRDGIGPDRSEVRLPRVGHGLRRLVVIGSDGLISLAALRWLVDQKAAFVMLDRAGHVLADTGPRRAGDARLRRAQALAVQTGAALPIIRELIERKIGEQERLLRGHFHDNTAAGELASARPALRDADSPDAIRLIEAQAGLDYWSVWRDLLVGFPKKDRRRVPAHWRVFGARRSPLSGSQRLAVNPANAMLNYLYAILESEARRAAAILGLDPTMGLLHADAGTRDSLACDLMEPVRPLVDAYVLNWLTRSPLRREWFFEQRDGSCRLMASFARQLAETAPTWARALAPIAERVAEMLWTTTRRPKPQGDRRPALLTQRQRRQARGRPAVRRPPLPPIERVCPQCGVIVHGKQQHCPDCARALRPETFTRVMEVGRQTAQTPRARAKRSATQRRHNRARAAWTPADLPAWLTPEFFEQQIQPRLVTLTTAAIRKSLRVSESYAAQIRTGKCRPHPRHWRVLAALVTGGAGTDGLA